MRLDQLHYSAVNTQYSSASCFGKVVSMPPLQFGFSASKLRRHTPRALMQLHEALAQYLCSHARYTLAGHLLASRHSACILLHCHGNREHTNNLLCTFLSCFLACFLACWLAWFIAHFLSCFLASLCVFLVCLLSSLLFSLLSILLSRFVSCLLAHACVSACNGLHACLLINLSPCSVLACVMC